MTKASSKRRVFLLSPANLSGRRTAFLLNPGARSELGGRLRTQGAPLGEVFSFVSGLYFRGKLTYANTFCGPTLSFPTVFIITSSKGLVSPETLTSIGELREMAGVPIHHENVQYRQPLERDAAALMNQLTTKDEIVLLGSIATPKYLQPLLSVLGKRLVFPRAFVGLGDMARGSLLLRAAREGKQLQYSMAVRSMMKRRTAST
jgi:hypothetical protein